MRVLISSGPTREPLDSVRFLSNYSTGYMGSRLAEEGIRRGHRVTVVSGPVSEPLPRGARVIRVEQAREMEHALIRESRRADVVIMAAAVADFRPLGRISGKMRRYGAKTLRLKAVPDILARLPRRPGQVVAGFALETRAPLTHGKRKLRSKRLDLILAQRIGKKGPFGPRPMDAWLIGADGTIQRLRRCSKVKVARLLLDKIEGLWYGQSASMSSPRNGRSAC